MKIKELQIDDLILCDLSAFGAEPPYKEKCVVRKISRDAIECMPLDENGNDRYDYPIEVYESEIEPIPLTAEILEKNGFRNIGGHWYDDAADYYELEIEAYSDSIWRVIYHNTEFNIGDERVFVSHIHELQHALRLFGIKREIEL